MTAARIRIRVQASARENALLGVRDGVLAVRVTAPALEGRANEALRRLLAKRLRVPQSSVAVVRGHRSRDKVVAVEGVDPSELLERLGLRGQAG